MKQQDNGVLGRGDPSRPNPLPNRICIFDEAFSWPPPAKEGGTGIWSRFKSNRAELEFMKNDGEDPKNTKALPKQSCTLCFLTYKTSAKATFP